MYQPKWKMPEQKPKKPQPAQLTRELKMPSKFGMWWQKSKLCSWWKKIQQHRFIATVIVVTLFALIAAFTFAVYKFGWNWTGFNGGYPKLTTTKITPGTTMATEQQPTKTMWDVLQLLIVPIILAIGGFWLNQIQKVREQRAIDERVERENREAVERAEREKREVENRANIEREIAASNQREAALQAYLDRMSELLLDKDNPLYKSKPEDEVSKIGRVRTLTVLQRLDVDGKRKGVVLQFLFESGLINSNELVINLVGAKLAKSELTGINLAGANLVGTDLSEAQLAGADLTKADLTGANLAHADLSRAKLTGTDLTHAELEEANLDKAIMNQTRLGKANLVRAILAGTNLVEAVLTDANMFEARLRGAILDSADLTRATVTEEELRKVASRRNIIMPGQEYDKTL
jgi:uncharacterized protein YjbI with pentapeptide repeats